MNMHSDITQELANLSTHLNRAKSLAAFVDLKKSEIRPGDRFGFASHIGEEQELKIEKSVLAGQMFDVQQQLDQMRVRLPANVARLLNDVRVFLTIAHC